MKKLIALVLALALVLAVAVASAATITINPAPGWNNDENTAAAETYTAYKVLDVVFATGTTHGVTDSNVETAKTNSTGFTYKVMKTSPWKQVVLDATFFKTTEKKDYYLVELADGLTANASQAQTMAAYFKAHKPDDAEAINLTVNASTHVATSGTIDDGYYYIESNVGEKLILATSDITITEKNSYPNIVKTVKSTDAVAQIGTDVEWTSVINVPKGADKAITFTDTMSKGLTFTEIVSVKNASNANVTYSPSTVTASAVTGTDNTQFVLTFDADTVKANAEGTITIVYKTKINKDAVVYTNIPNEAKIDYGTYSQHSTANTKTAGFKILKYDGSDTAQDPLAGAVFNLKVSGSNTYIDLVMDASDNSIYSVADATQTTGTTQDITTVAGKQITIKGLDSDVTYKLVEKTAPTGFNKITGDIGVTIETTELHTNPIENNKGTELPSTGGIGTTIFYILGGLLVVGATVILVARRKAQD